MNLAAIAKILAGFVLFFSLAQLVPLGFAVLEEGAPEPFAPVAGFGTGTVAGLLAAAVLWRAGRGTETDFFRREALGVVGLAWVLAGALGAAPFLVSGVLPRAGDAFFESVSGLTTTGASVLGTAETPSIESLPQSILLWRAMLQWLGGMGIILVFIVLLPAMGVAGKNLLSSEQVGVPDHSQRPRLQEQARGLFLVYLTLTVLDVVLLRIAGMETWFEAVCHAFTTMSTGGFSTRTASIGGFESLAIELVTILFMLVAGMNFVLLLGLAKNGFRSLKDLLWAPEIRTYLLLTAGLVLATAVVLATEGGTLADRLTGEVRDYSSFGACLRDAAFNVVSIQTSTGYATADFEAWPKTTLVILILCMLIGGCTGSTAGGLKVLRLMVTGKLIGYTVRHFMRPKSVQKVRVGAEVVPNSIISSILALTVLWIVSIALGTLALSLDARLDLLSAFSANVSMMGCTGPALTELGSLEGGRYAIDNLGGIDLGPAGSYGMLGGAAKLMLSVEMIFGRLEILAPLMLFLPSFWRR